LVLSQRRLDNRPQGSRTHHARKRLGIVTNPNNTEDQTNRDSLDELEKLLIIKFGSMMIGKEYPNVGQLVSAAIQLIKQHDEEVATWI